MAVPAVTVLNQIIDKSVLYRRAIELGVPVPKTWFPDSVENLRDVSRRVAYPCLLKPAVSHRFFAAYGKKLVVASDRDGLESAFTDAHARGIVTLVSEIVEGDDTCLFHYRSYLDGGGRVLAELCTRKIRQHPAGFGVASFSRTIPMIGAIRAHTLSLLRHAGYRGVSSAEFKRDARDGQFKLLEINARPVLPERLFAEAGVNFSRIGYRDAVENRAGPLPSYETNVYWVHNFLETIRLLYHRDLGLSDYLRPYREKRLITCIPFLKDPMPFLSSLWNLCRQTAPIALGAKKQ